MTKLNIGFSLFIWEAGLYDPVGMQMYSEPNFWNLHLGNKNWFKKLWILRNWGVKLSTVFDSG